MELQQTELQIPKEPRCLGCGGPQGEIDTVLTLEQWQLVHQARDGVLCANCIVSRAAKLPEVICASLRLMFPNDYEEDGDQFWYAETRQLVNALQERIAHLEAALYQHT